MLPLVASAAATAAATARAYRLAKVAKEGAQVLHEAILLTREATKAVRSAATLSAAGLSPSGPIAGLAKGAYETTTTLVTLAEEVKTLTGAAAQAARVAKVSAGGTVAAAIVDSPTIHSIDSDLVEERFSFGSSDFVAGAGGVSLDGLLIGDLVVAAAPYIKEAALAVTPGAGQAEEAIVQAGLEQSLVKARETYEAEDNIAIERALGSRQSPSYIIPDQKPVSLEKKAAIWSAAAGENYTPNFSEDSDEICESIDPSMSSKDVFSGPSIGV